MGKSRLHVIVGFSILFILFLFFIVTFLASEQRKTLLSQAQVPPDLSSVTPPAGSAITPASGQVPTPVIPPNVPDQPGSDNVNVCSLCDANGDQCITQDDILYFKQTCRANPSDERCRKIDFNSNGVIDNDEYMVCINCRDSGWCQTGAPPPPTDDGSLPTPTSVPATPTPACRQGLEYIIKEACVETTPHADIARAHIKGFKCLNGPEIERDFGCLNWTGQVEKDLVKQLEKECLEQYVCITPTPTTTPLTPIVTKPVLTPPVTCATFANGDCNCDGTVNLADFILWLNGFNGNPSEYVCDINLDGLIDLLDFSSWWSGMFGQSS